MERRKNIIRWGAVIIWMGIIFFFSSQAGEDSSQNNAFIVQILSQLGLHFPNGIWGWDINLIIRKLAHMTEYFILAFLLIRALDDGQRSVGRILLLSGLISFLYACSDEFHQRFTPERGPRIQDVFIDSIGIIFALIFRILGSKVRYMFQKGQDKQRI